MGILSGLQNGYATYFMPQPAQGLNPQILAMAMQGNRRSSSGMGRSKASSKSSVTKEDEVEGAQGVLVDYTQKKEYVDQVESQATQAFVDDMFKNGTDDITSLKTYTPYVQAKQWANQKRGELDINKSLMKEGLKIYDDTRNRLSSDGLTGNAFVGRWNGVQGMAFAGGTESSLVGMNKNGDAVSAFKQGDNGEIIFDKENVISLMGMQEGMDYQNRNNKLNPATNRAELPVTPSFFKPGTLTAFLQKQVEMAHGSISEDITGSKDGKVEFKRGDNYDQLKSILSNSLQTSDQSLLNEASSNWGDAIITGKSFLVPEREEVTVDGKKGYRYRKYKTTDQEVIDKKANVGDDVFVAKKAEDITLQEYITSQAAGLIPAASQLKKDTKDASGIDKTGGGSNDPMYNQMSLMFNLNFAKNMAVNGGGSVASSPYYEFNKTNGAIPSQFDQTDGKNYAVYINSGSAEYVQKRRQQYSVGAGVSYNSLPDAVDIFAMKKGLITPGNLIMDPAKLKNGIRILDFTGELRQEPTYQTESGKLTHKLKYQDGSKKMMEYGNTEGVRVVVLGSDVQKYFNVPIVDEELTAKTNKVELDKWKESLPGEAFKYINAIDEVTNWQKLENDPKRRLENEQYLKDIQTRYDEWKADHEDEMKKVYVPKSTSIIMTGYGMPKEEISNIDRYGGGAINHVTIGANGSIKQGEKTNKIKPNEYYVMDLRYQSSMSDILDWNSTKENASKLDLSLKLSGYEENPYVEQSNEVRSEIATGNK